MYKRYALLLALLISGCAAKQVYIKSYSGVTLPPSELALVKPAAFIGIHAIDDGGALKIVPSEGLRVTEFEIALLPGEHTFNLSYNNGVVGSISDVQIKVSVEAGHKYLIKPRHNSDQTWTPEFTDVTNRSECWTINVGVWGGPKNC